MIRNRTAFVRKSRPDWRDLVVSREKSLREVLRFIDDKARQIALVTDQNDTLLGTITDGDIRRGLLRGVDMEASCSVVMNSNPVTYETSVPRAEIVRTMKDEGIRHIPLLGQDGRVVDLMTLSEIMGAYRQDSPVVIMAGGQGKRLGELTHNCPKPMLDVGGRPILETIIQNFIDQGFFRFFISVNYLSAQIKQYFGDGEKWNVHIQYLEEEQPLGTAGSLGLLKEDVDRPLIVMNGDLLTKVNSSELLNFHRDTKSCATMCVREFDLKVPYGVVETDGHNLKELVEKPMHKFFVNAGIYVLSPEALDSIPDGEFFDMTSLFQTLLKKGESTTTFPVHEYWRDIGQLPDFQSAVLDYPVIFS